MDVAPNASTRNTSRNTSHNTQPTAPQQPSHRFANPVALNGAAGWVFINGPDDIQHVCALNTRNYAERYLPVGLAATHAP